jgi:CBS domain-containing membrane protein
VKVRELMQTNVVTLKVGEPLDVADDIMTLGRIRHLPVVDTEGHIAGVVTHRDLLSASTASVLRAGRMAQRNWLGKIKVENVMAVKVKTVTADTDVSTAIDLMLAEKIGCLPVVAGSELVGLLTETDCLRVLRDLLAPERAATVGC